MRRERRKTILIDKPFQLRSAVKNLFYMLVVGVCLSLPFLYYIHSTNFLIYNHSDELSTMVSNQQRATVTTVVLYFSLLILIAFLFSLVQSHRIAGPMVGLKKGMEKIGEGRFSTRVHFRAGDEMKELADTFNRMAEALEAREQELSGFQLNSSSSSKNSIRSSLNASRHSCEQKT